MKDQFKRPEYKDYKPINQSSSDINSYLNPIKQYQYKDPHLTQSTTLKPHREIALYSLEKSKRFVKSSKYRDDIPTYHIREKTNDDRITLKEAVNFNILHPNYLPIENSTKNSRRMRPPNKNPNMDEVRLGAYLESRDSPEYLRMYDREKLGEIDKYYIKKNENTTILSRFGEWLTLRPGVKNRGEALEKQKHGTFETSKNCPEWMELKYTRNYQSPIKRSMSYQGSELKENQNAF